MDMREEMVEKVKRGQKKFNKLYALSDAELKKLMASRYGQGHAKHLFEGDNARITRTIVNEEPHSIKFEFYDAIEINWTGIHFIPEHGSRGTMMKFDVTKEGDALTNFLQDEGN